MLESFTGKALVRLTSADVVLKACAMDVIACKKSCIQCISYQETVQIATEASYEVEQLHALSNVD